MLIATPLLLLACWYVVGQKMFRIPARDSLIMLLTGSLLAISHATYFAAIRYSGVTIATLLTICLAPLFVTAFSVLMKFETLSRRTIIALLCALSGSVLLVGLQAPEGNYENLLLGTVFALIAAISYAGVIIGGRFLAAGYHPLQVTALTFSAGTVVLLLINLMSGIVVAHTSQGWLLIVYLGLVPTALAYWLFQVGLRSVSATAASIVGLLDPLVAALLAWGLFGETLASAGIIGAGLLMISIYLLAGHKRE
jgi:drug/metabolite transporter, DME family